MNRDQTLQRIEHATDEGEVMAALRDFVADPANGHDPRLDTLLGNGKPIDVPSIAFELTRFRLAARDNDMATADVETVFARASVRIAELHDHTGGWKAYKVRTDSRPPAKVDQAPDTDTTEPDKKTNGAK